MSESHVASDEARAFEAASEAAAASIAALRARAPRGFLRVGRRIALRYSEICAAELDQISDSKLTIRLSGGHSIALDTTMEDFLAILREAVARDSRNAGIPASPQQEGG